MNARARTRGFSRVLMAVALACGVSLVPSRSYAAEKPPSHSVTDLTRMLLGTLRGSDPGNELQIVLSRVALAPASVPRSQLEWLEVRVTRKYNGDAVFLRGLWRISYQGDGVL